MENLPFWSIHKIIVSAALWQFLWCANENGVWLILMEQNSHPKMYIHKKMYSLILYFNFIILYYTFILMTIIYHWYIIWASFSCHCCFWVSGELVFAFFSRKLTLKQLENKTNTTERGLIITWHMRTNG